MYHRSFLLLLTIVLSCSATLCLAQHACHVNPDHDDTAKLLALFPGDGRAPSGGETRFDSAFSSSKSTWNGDANEKDVFQYFIQHKGKPQHDWTIRIGKGGMIYSFLGPFGESVPPQRPESVWNDEVWQLVAVNGQRLGPAQDASKGNRVLREKLRSFYYFAHQSGTYNRDPAFKDTFYSPLLVEHADRKARSYASLNWIQQAHVPSVWQSHLYCYQRIRDLGDGVIELTYVMYNGGEETINHMNVPWGGVRYSSLPIIMVSQAEGGWEKRDDIYGDRSSMTQAQKTNGWIGWAAEDKPDSHALLLVHGRNLPGKAPTMELKGTRLVSKVGRPAAVRWGTAIKHKPERDYSVVTMSWKPIVEPGQTAFYRSYFVVGPRDQSIEKAIALAPNAGGGLLQFDSDQVPLVRLNSGDQDSPFAYAWPVADAKPLLLIRNTKTRQLIVTTDPYHLVPGEGIENPMPKNHPKRDVYDGLQTYRPYLAPVEYVALLGYAQMPQAGKPVENRLPGRITTPWGAARVADDARGASLPDAPASP